LFFRKWVNTGSGFVQDENGGVLRQYAQQSDQLALPHGNLCAAFPDAGVQPLGKGAQPFPAANLAGQVENLLAGDVLSGKTDVLFHGSLKQERDLGDQTHMLAQCVQVVAADVFAVDQQLPGLEFVKTGDQARDGGLSSAGMSHNGDVFALADVQGKVVQDGFSVGIAEPELVKINFPAVVFRFVCTGLDDGVFRVNQRKNPFRRG